MNKSCHAYAWVMSLVRMSHVAHGNETCHTFRWVMSHVWMREHLVSHTNWSCHTYEWDMSHIWMIRVTHMSDVTNKNESCCTYEWVMSHIWMSHVTHMNINASSHSHEWDMSHVHTSKVAHMNKSSRAVPKLLREFNAARWHHWIFGGTNLFAFFRFDRVCCHKIRCSMHRNWANGQHRLREDKQQADYECFNRTSFCMWVGGEHS